ncbi:MAG: methyltransferase domain-containing protein [Bdellovibrionota bacterium]
MNTLLFACDCLKGTKDFAQAEILKLGKNTQIFDTNDDELIIFSANEDYGKLKTLKKIVNIYYLLCYKVKGPGSLLNIKYLSDICLHIQKASENSLDFKPSSFRISAAGSASETFKTIAEKITHFTGLTCDNQNGDMLIRFRRTPNKNFLAWEVLIRVSSRPLSYRSWRTKNFRGALNPIIANVLYDLIKPKKGDKLLNAMCGSGTILIEAGNRNKLSKIVGVDNNEEVLKICDAHILNSKLKNIEVYNMDARKLNFSDSEFDIALSDLPWGENIGNIKDNFKLYEDVLKELSRVVVKNGNIGVITQDIKNLELAIKSCNLKIIEKGRVYQGGFTPYMVVIKNLKV